MLGSQGRRKKLSCDQSVSSGLRSNEHSPCSLLDQSSLQAMVLLSAGKPELHNDADKLWVTAHGFRTVDSQLLLLQLTAEYLHFLDLAPSLALEVAHRVVELVKVFVWNHQPVSLSLSCVLVLKRRSDGHLNGQ